MKIAKVIRGLMRGQLRSTFVLSLMMTMTLFTVVMVFGSLQYIIRNYATIKRAELQNAFYVQNYDTVGIADLSKTERIIASIKGDPDVKSVHAVRTVNPLNYKDDMISIVLLDEKMLDCMGLHIEDESGCILASRIFNGHRRGGKISFSFPWSDDGEETFTVSGHLSYPYTFIYFPNAHTNANANDLFTSSDVVLMKESDALISRLSERARITTGVNFIVEFNDGVDAAGCTAILSAYAPDHSIVSMEDIYRASEEKIVSDMRHMLPMPLFLLCVSTVAYLSTSILFFKKKESHLAISYLCGCSKRRCAAVMFAAITSVSAIPVLINIVFVCIVPYLDWMGYIDMYGFVINGNAILLILGYYLFTAIIAVGVTAGGMRKHTPVTLLRGTSL